MLYLNKEAIHFNFFTILGPRENSYLNTNYKL